jgi:hypothetical protein
LYSCVVTESCTQTFILAVAFPLFFKKIKNKIDAHATSKAVSRDGKNQLPFLAEVAGAHFETTQAVFAKTAVQGSPYVSVQGGALGQHHIVFYTK